MKIGVNSRIFQNTEGGIPFFIKNLYTTLVAEDIKNEYYFFQTDDIKKLGRTKTIKINTSLASGVFFDLFLILGLIKKEGINILHGTSHVLPFIKIKNTKYIVTIHDLSFLIYPNQYSRLFRVYYREVIRRSLRNADLIVADSHNTKEDILRYYKIKESRVRVIHLGISDHFFQRESLEVQRLVSEKYFFSLTTHPKRKNIYSILSILSRNNKLKDIKYVIAGLISDDYLNELKEDILRLGLKDRVILFGYVTEGQLRNLYQFATFFIYPSFYEGFGFPILESMASQTPVIASGTSSMIEIMPEAEWLVNPHDLDDIQNKMEKMIELSEASRKFLIQKNLAFSKEFTWKKTASDYLKIYYELENS